MANTKKKTKSENKKVEEFTAEIPVVEDTEEKVAEFTAEIPVVEDTEEKVAELKAEYVSVLNCKKVRLRKTAEEADNVLAIVEAGTKLEVVESGNIWTKVIYNETTCYVMTKFVK